MNRARHRILALAVLGLVLARPGAAESGAPVPVVESVGPSGYRVRVPTGEAEVIRGDVLGHAFAEILVPGAQPSAFAPDLPPLPARTVLLRAPWGVRATVTSVSILAQVPLSAVLAAIFLGEPLSSAQVIGGIVVLAGIYVVTRP